MKIFFNYDFVVKINFEGVYKITLLVVHVFDTIGFYKNQQYVCLYIFCILCL